jgi:hypothetical protein
MHKENRIKLHMHLNNGKLLYLDYQHETRRDWQWKSFKGSFTYDVITEGEGGGFQMMTIDDGGGRGGLANDDVTKNCQIFGRFLGISSYS